MSERNFWFFQTFQRIQRNRQSRIRVKLSRRAGKRPDEVLEEEMEEMDGSAGSPNPLARHFRQHSSSHTQTSTPGKVKFSNDPNKFVQSNLFPLFVIWGCKANCINDSTSHPGS